MSEERKRAWTPGPWFAERQVVALGKYPIYASFVQPLRLQVYGPDWKHDNPEINGPNSNFICANAHLIAAAPELYEACEKALNYIANTESEFGMTLDSGDALRAALAKARGEQS